MLKKKTGAKKKGGGLKGRGGRGWKEVSLKESGLFIRERGLNRVELKKGEGVKEREGLVKNDNRERKRVLERHKLIRKGWGAYCSYSNGMVRLRIPVDGHA